jgi:hypothetical protein
MYIYNNPQQKKERTLISNMKNLRRLATLWILQASKELSGKIV